MTKLSDAYLDGVMAILTRIKIEEEEALKKAAILITDKILAGKRIFAFGCTHSSLPIQDLVYRAGGMMLVNPIFGPGIQSLDVHPATMTSAIERLEGFAEILLDNSPIEEGDVLIVVSISGRNAVPVEIAQIASERGIKVIAVTSFEYTKHVDSRHPSGKKMYEFADIVLDNKVPKGDALVEAEGFPVKFTPASGIASIAVLQTIMTMVVEEMLERGEEPPVLISANVDGGADHNKRLWDKYQDQIFYI